jgi:prepilin-type N-terminal cleavage/methylation domain-containing protein
MNLPPHSRTAFTLIELLTVVAIIGILAAITFAGLRSVRLAARRSESISNLRQIGISFALYAQDNRDNLPTIQTGTESTYWWSHVSPYLNGGTKANDWSAFARIPTLRSTWQSQKIADYTGKAWLSRTPPVTA